jgi:hypothetical protein
MFKIILWFIIAPVSGIVAFYFLKTMIDILVNLIRRIYV